MTGPYEIFEPVQQLLGVRMFMLIFVVGLLLGTLIGGGLCVRYLRREIAADIGPQLRQLNLKVETLESVVNLALATRYAELSAAPSARAVNNHH
jgi:ABC-type lipoprotein release transport system permease subunit